MKRTQARLPFSLTVLGSGTCTPSAQRGTAAYLVCAGAKKYLLDCGSGTIARLAALGIPVHDLDAIFCTHTHLDHSGDLFNILFSLRNAGGMRRREPVNIFGPPGFHKHYDALMKIYGSWVVSPDYCINVEELGGDVRGMADGPLNVDAYRVRHSAAAVGYRFTVTDALGPRSLAFTGDADEGKELIPLLSGVDLALMDCSTLDEDKIPGHLSAGQVGRVAAAARPRLVVLTHFYPPLCADPTLAQAQVQRLSGLPTVAAWDGATIEIGGESGDDGGGAGAPLIAKPC